MREMCQIKVILVYNLNVCFILWYFARIESVLNFKFYRMTLTQIETHNFEFLLINPTVEETLEFNCVCEIL